VHMLFATMLQQLHHPDMRNLRFRLKLMTLS
jgi:hypothetical protein